VILEIAIFFICLALSGVIYYFIRDKSAEGKDIDKLLYGLVITTLVATLCNLLPYFTYILDFALLGMLVFRRVVHLSFKAALVYMPILIFLIPFLMALFTYGFASYSSIGFVVYGNATSNINIPTITFDVNAIQFGSITLFIAAICLIAAVGINIFGSGLTDKSVHIVSTALFFSALYFAIYYPTYWGLTVVVPAPAGSFVFWVVTIVYMFGVIMRAIEGGEGG
jgi:hypothetical protein